MYTTAALKAQTVKDLGKLAQKIGVEGWRSMRKDELVKALVRAAKRKAAKRAKAATKKKSATRPAAKSTKAPTRKAKAPAVTKKIERANKAREDRRNLASNGNGKPAKDRIILLVRDAYWLQAMWELTSGSIERARAAMAEQWHTARPILRVIQVGSSGNNGAERVVREIDIHGGVKVWYIDIQESPKTYRVEVGYLASNGRFYSLARSNSVTTPRAGTGDEAASGWSDIADNCEKIYALSGGYEADSSGDLQEIFEERLGRRMGAPAGTQFGVGADKTLGRNRDFDFDVDAEMIVYGVARPNAHVTLAGTPLKLQPDGSFSARMSMPDRRQVLPIVASSGDGVEQRTVVLAVERNTKVMEPMIRESGDET